MTPAERCEFLIKQLGPDKALDHVNWVIETCEKKLTKEYWKSVIWHINKHIFESPEKIKDEQSN